MLLGAVIFDLDGVITDTAKIHSVAWKYAFDEFLEYYKKEHPEEFTADPKRFREFTSHDYEQLVDGIPRYDGVERFLESRGILISRGNPNDSAGFTTACAIGNYKNVKYLEVLEKQPDGITVFKGTLRLIKELKEEKIPMAVASSSKNCIQILELTKLKHYFSVFVEGNYIEQSGIKGKPAPDMFLEAARQLGVVPENAVVIEDAVKGVQAGIAGGFRLVIGVARQADAAQQFKKDGAHLVVNDLSETSLEAIRRDHFSSSECSFRKRI